MASCSLGASNIKISDAVFVRPKNGVLGQRVGRVRTSTVWKLGHRVSLAISRSLERPVTVLSHASSDSDAATKVDDSPEVTTSSFTSELIPNSYEVESLLTAICDTTSIAEFELKLAGFQLSVTRNLSEKNTILPPSSLAPAHTQTISEPSDSNGSVTTSSLAVYEPSKSSGSIQSLLDKASDEGLAILRSPRVGYFRRSRTIKGKRAPPSCKEKQIVKEGQIICYIEQLGGEIPIESETSGEVIKILREDGDAVGYGDALIAILPSFPGIKKLQ